MKIGIDCRPIQKTPTNSLTGVGYYIYYLVSGLIDSFDEDEFVLFFEHLRRDLSKLKPEEIFKRGELLQNTEGAEFLRPNVTIRYFHFSEFKKFLPVIYSHILIGGFLNFQKLDVFHGPANVIPLGFRGKSVITIHDLTIYKHPEWFPSGQGFAKSVAVPQSLRQADKIIAVSESTKRDIVELHKIPAEKISVVPNGVNLSKFKPAEDKSAAFHGVAAKYKFKRPYILYLGTLEPRKNLVRLVEAYALINSRNPELARNFDLVLAGSRGWLYSEIFEAVKNHRLENRVVFPGYIADEDVPKLMQAAEVFVFPSLYEGFGLPVLEAMSCGTPVVTSEISALPEVGGNVPAYINPYETEDLANALERLLASEDEKNRQREQGPKQAQKFTWAHTVQATHKVYEEIVK